MERRTRPSSGEAVLLRLLSLSGVDDAMVLFCVALRWVALIADKH